MSALHIDLETRSAADLKKTGLYVYAEDPTTDVWCACFCVDDGPILTWRPGEPCPPEIVNAVDQSWLVFGHNVGFEHALWTYVLGPKYGWPVPDFANCRCTAAMAAAMALPRDLAGAAVAMGMEEQKDMAGKRLMMQLARPRKHEPGQAPVWWDVPEKVERLIAYCKQDVEVERALTKRLRPLPESEQRLFQLDHEINVRGIRIDLRAVANAQAVARKSLEALNSEVQRLTDFRITTVNQSALLGDWLREQGVDVESVDKAAVKTALAADCSPRARRVLEIRQEAAKSSTAKLEAFRLRTNRDGRTRETLMYHGAGTGRWSGRGIQVQNFPRPTIDYEDTVAAIDAMRLRDPAWLELWGRPLHVVADCLRGMIVAEPGHELVTADFSNIEGRVLAWLAGEHWKLQAFRDFDLKLGPDLYLVTAARIYGVATESLNKHSKERQIGKVAELACGYQGGVGAFQSMAVNYPDMPPVSDAEADVIKTAWREAHPATKALWYAAEDAAFQAVVRPGQVEKAGKVSYVAKGGVLWCKLPSGRLLAYVDPQIREVDTPWGEKKQAVTYMGVDSMTRQWKRHKAYGGLWVENITQAVARDIMAEAMLRIEARGWPIVLSVHDELVSEVPVGSVTAAEYGEEMRKLPEWAAGLPVAAEGLTSLRYRK